MLRIAIYDEDNELNNDITGIISNIYRENINKGDIHSFQEYNRFLKELFRNDIQYDILIINISLPDMKGLELAGKVRELDRDILIVFMSSCSEKVYDVFDYNPVQFVRKENQAAELYKALKQCEDILDKNKSRYICISNREGEQRLLLKDITYIEKQDRKILICMNNHKEFLIRDTMKTFSEKIIRADSGFVMIGSSCVINLRYLERMDNQSAYLTNGIKLPVSRRYHKQLAEKYMLMYS